MTPVDPRDPISRLSRGSQGFNKFTLEGHNAVPANTPGTLWGVNRKSHGLGGGYTSPRIKTTTSHRYQPWKQTSEFGSV